MRLLDEKWGFSAVLSTFGLDGMYIMGALVLVGGCGWFNIGENNR